MSPSTLKSKDKATTRPMREQPKASSKASAVPGNGGNSVATSAYNPPSGTFHALESMPSNGMLASQSNGRLQTIDETEDYSCSSLGTAADYDSLSNNGSCSGESEDQQKDRNTSNGVLRVEPVPGSDVDKREKIRIKNEKKHQRKKQRRALELRERCCSYLTSRKLESLAQKLVAMGFTSNQATMALIHNEGRVDESALWLLEGGEESKRQAGSNLVNSKINIAAELAKIKELAISFNCAKQEVERAVVACEGDLEKAEQTLKTQLQEYRALAQPTVSVNGFQNSRLATTCSENPAIVRTQAKGIPLSIQLQRRDEKDFNYTKSTIAAASTAQMEAASRSLQPSLRKLLPSNSDWMNPPQTSMSSSHSVPYSMPSPLQVAAAQVKLDTGHATAEFKSNLYQGATLREPVVVMQRPQSKQSITPSSVGLSASPPASNGWYPASTSSLTALEMMNLANGGLGQQLRSLALSGSNLQQFYAQDNRQQFVFPSSADSGGVPGWNGGSYNRSVVSTRSSSSSSLATPSSLGLFTGTGSSGSLSAVDWGICGSIPQCDYTSIDWSLDSTLLPPLPTVSSVKGLYDSSWRASYDAAEVTARPAVNGIGVGGGGLQNGSLVADLHHAAPSAADCEWTSPFGGSDLFGAPGLFVTSPSP